MASRKGVFYCGLTCSVLTRKATRQKRSKSITNSPYKDIILSIFDNECQFCTSRNNLLIHHKIPVASGGRNHISNIIVLCKKCHLMLHYGGFNKILEEKMANES